FGYCGWKFDRHAARQKAVVLSRAQRHCGVSSREWERPGDICPLINRDSPAWMVFMWMNSHRAHRRAPQDITISLCSLWLTVFIHLEPGIKSIRIHFRRRNE